MLLTTILVVVGLCVGGAENWKMENCPVTSKPVTEKPITEEPVTKEPVTEEPARLANRRWSTFSGEHGQLIDARSTRRVRLKCVEPIAIKCQITYTDGGLGDKIGIAGFNDSDSGYTFLTVSEEQFLEKTLICSPSSAMWHIEEVPEDEYSSFTCAYMFSNGTWL